MNVNRARNGFTLIELVIVIVILGILAAVAIPKYVTVQKEARIAVVNGMAGGLRSARLVAMAKYQVVSNTTATTVDMDGTLVEVTAGTGVPTPTQAGIVTALTDTSGFTVNIGASKVEFQPTNGGGPNCEAVYSGATGTVGTDVSNCGL